MSLSKIKAPSDLWERCERKLLVYIMEGISLVTKHGAGNPYVKLIYDKQKHKTQTLKHAEDVSWKEMFMFEVNDETTELVLEVYTKAGLASGDKLIGSCKVCIPSELHPEEVIDRVVDLEIPATTKAKHKEMLDSRIGNIHLRMLFSREREYPIRPPPNQCSLFRYRDHYRNMQTGDLLVYSGVGSVDALCKIHSGTRYSRVGLIVRMPNKWTGKEKLFVFEVGRNLPHELDAFKDSAQSGASLFRLFEHIHAISATDIWWVPLKMPLEQATSANMVDWIKEVVARKVSIDLPAPPHEMVEFFERYEMQLLKHPFATAEICSASSMISALRLGGKRFPFEHSYISCVQLMSQDCFGDPVLIRERSGVPMPIEAPFGGIHVSSLDAGRSSSAALKRATMMSESGGVVGGAIVGSVPAEEGSVSQSNSGLASRSGSVHGNEVVAPRAGPIAAVPEPQRIPTQQALSRPDALPHSFSSQHLANSPEESISDAGSSEAIPQSASQQLIGARHAQQGSQGQQEGYRRPSNAPMPIAPPGPSILGLPNFQGQQQQSSPGSSPNKQEETGQSNPLAMPAEHQPSANYVVTTVSTEPEQQQAGTGAPESSPPRPIAGRRSPAALTVTPGTIASQTPAAQPPPPDTAPKPKPRRDPSKKLRPATAKPGALTPLDSGDSDAQSDKPRLLPAPSGRSMTMAVPVRPNLQEDGSSRTEAGGNGDSSTQDPSHIRQPSSEALGAPPLVPDKRLKKKKLPAPPSQAIETTIPPISVSPPPASELPPPPSYDVAVGTVAPPSSLPASDAPSPTTEAGSAQPPELPLKPKKKKARGVPSLDVEGLPVVVQSKKRKSPRKNRESAMPALEAMREDLDEPTKTELRRRRVGSVRILPESAAAQSWQAAVNGQHESPQQPAPSSTPTAPKLDEAPSAATTTPASPKEIVVSPDQPIKTAMVLWTFEAMADSELTVEEGTKVQVLELAGEWALCEYQGRAGAVPVSFLSIDS